MNKKIQKIIVEINRLQIEKDQISLAMREIDEKIKEYKSELEDTLDFGTYQVGDIECIKIKKVQKGRETVSYKNVLQHVTQQMDTIKDTALRKHPDCKVGILFYNRNLQKQHDLCVEMNTKKGESTEVVDISIYRVK